MKPINNSIDDPKYHITYIFPEDRQLRRDEMIGRIDLQRAQKSKDLLADYLSRTKVELTEEQKAAKAKELLEVELKRGGTFVILAEPPECDSNLTGADQAPV